METTQKPNSFATLTDEQFEAEAKRRKQLKAETKKKQEDSYNALKEATLIKLGEKSLELNELLKKFKTDAFEEMNTLYSLLQEYSARHADGKGNFKIDNPVFRIQYKKQGKPTFDERADQAEKHIIDFVNQYFEKDLDTKDLIMSLLERKKGELDINLIQKLYQMEDRFDNENWIKGIELLKESYQYSHSKDYIRFEKKNDKGVWETINLQFSSL